MHLDMTVTVSATFRSTSRHVLGPSEREQDASSTPGGFHKAHTVGWSREWEGVGVGGQAGNDVINLPNQGRATVVEIGAVLPALLSL